MTAGGLGGDRHRNEGGERVRAAQYVRMSTEHQQYSTENQADAIRQYAERRGIEIVRTYADEGRSGLRLDGRNALNLEREFKLAEQSYGSDHLNLVLARGYLCKLLGNARVLRYLAQHHQEILSEFQRIAELEMVAA